MTRKLYRSSSNKVIAGICAGIGEHFDVDPTLIRLITVVAALASFGAVVIFYLIAWIVIPQPAPGEIISNDDGLMTGGTTSNRSGWRIYLPGIILIALGVMFLLPEYIPGFRWHDIWPLLLVLLGLMLILRSGRSSRPPAVPPTPNPGPQGREGGIHP